MRVFAIDTSTPRVVACYFDEKRKIFAELETKAKHGVQVGQIASMMADVDFESLDIVCVGTGPGGLTGLRVGIAFATALGIEKKFVPLNSLELIGMNAAFFHGFVIVLRKAREGYLYGAVFEARSGRLSEIEKPFIDSVDRVGEKLDGYEPKILLGDGAEFFTPPLHPEWNLPSAKALYVLANEGIERGTFVALPEPVYLQKSIAELNFEKRGGRL